MRLRNSYTESQVQPLVSPPRFSHTTVLTSELDLPAAVTKGDRVDEEKSGLHKDAAAAHATRSKSERAEKREERQEAVGGTEMAMTEPQD